MNRLMSMIVASVLVAAAADWVAGAAVSLAGYSLRFALYPSRLVAARTGTAGKPQSRLLEIALFSACLLAGCNTRPYVTEKRFDEGLVVILPGIEGPSLFNANIRRGLYDGGVPYALEIYNWHNYRPGVAYAFSEAASRKRAGEVAARIEKYRSEHPGRPVFVIGHSAGGAIGTFTAEAVGAEAPIDGLIILAPALSPSYDVTSAIAGANGHMVVCHAHNDLFLRTLTTIGQNFDGAKGATAGQEGFFLSEDADHERREAFNKLIQIRWDKAMKAEGNFGGHKGWTSPRWVRAALVPYLDQWSRRDGEPQDRVKGGTP